MGTVGATRGAVSEKSMDEDSDGLRELGAVKVVVEAAGKDTSLDSEVMLSDALLERRRWKGLRCAREAIELRRFIELRRESEEGVTSLERDLRAGILVPFGWVRMDNVGGDGRVGCCTVRGQRNRRSVQAAASTPAAKQC